LLKPKDTNKHIIIAGGAGKTDIRGKEKMKPVERWGQNENLWEREITQRGADEKRRKPKSAG